MFSRLHTFIGGTHIDAAKNLTAELPIEAIPAPEKVVLPLSMHIGAPAKPLVQPGEKVYLGQKIAEAQGAVSSNIHASVSGMVVGSERRFLPNGTVAACMVIKNDGQDTLDPTITPRESGLVLPPDEIRQLLAEKGIVGMGGATFPTHVKYAPQSSGRIIDTVILNGIECEPFITADYRILIEHADEVIRGLKYFLKASLANKGIIAIEDNKPRAIELFNQLTADDTLITGQVVFNCQSRLHCGGYIIYDHADSRGQSPFRDNAAGNGIDQMAFAALRIFFGTDNDADIRIVSSKLIKKLDSPWFIIFDGNYAFVG